MENNFIKEVYEAFERYRKDFKKCGITPAIIESLEESAIITEHYVRYENNAIQEEHTRIISALSYMNVCCSCSFFRSRVRKNYTAFGNIAFKIFDTNPYNTSIKTVRTYKFERK